MGGGREGGKKGVWKGGRHRRFQEAGGAHRRHRHRHRGRHRGRTSPRRAQSAVGERATEDRATTTSVMTTGRWQRPSAFRKRRRGDDRTGRVELRANKVLGESPGPTPRHVRTLSGVRRCLRFPGSASKHVRVSARATEVPPKTACPIKFVDELGGRCLAAREITILLLVVVVVVRQRLSVFAFSLSQLRIFTDRSICCPREGGVLSFFRTRPPPTDRRAACGGAPDAPLGGELRRRCRHTNGRSLDSGPAHTRRRQRSRFGGCPDMTCGMESLRNDRHKAPLPEDIIRKRAKFRSMRAQRLLKGTRQGQGAVNQSKWGGLRALRLRAPAVGSLSTTTSDNGSTGSNAKNICTNVYCTQSRSASAPAKSWWSNRAGIRTLSPVHRHARVHIRERTRTTIDLTNRPRSKISRTRSPKNREG